MGDLFTIMAIACMGIWLWGHLTPSTKKTLSDSAESVRDSIHNATKK